MATQETTSGSTSQNQALEEDRLEPLHNVRALLGGALAVAAQLPQDQNRDWIERLIAQADETLHALAVGDAEASRG